MNLATLIGTIAFFAVVALALLAAAEVLLPSRRRRREEKKHNAEAWARASKAHPESRSGHSK